jgi:hypothetical protein
MMNPAPLDALEVRAPLIIGITGHRDLRPQDLEALSEQVRQILRKLKSRYSSTPLVMLSALAEGTDRLAAKVALEPEMEAIFGHASELVRGAIESRNYENACECLTKLGKEALAENGDWVLLHRERPLELPHP